MIFCELYWYLFVEVYEDHPMFILFCEVFSTKAIRIHAFLFCFESLIYIVMTPRGDRRTKHMPKISLLYCTPRARLIKNLPVPLGTLEGKECVWKLARAFCYIACFYRGAIFC